MYDLYDLYDLYAWAKCQIFLEAVFIFNNIYTNLNKNFHT